MLEVRRRFGALVRGALEKLSTAIDADAQRSNDGQLQRAANTSLSRMQGRLLAAQRIGKMGSWELEIATGALWWSDEIYEIFDCRREAFAASYEGFVAYIHPEDLSSFQAAQSRALAGDQALDIEHRIVTPAGEVRWVHEAGELVRGPDGRPAQLAGIVQNITQRKQAEAHVKLLESAVSRLNDIVLITDARSMDGPDPRIVFVNEAFERVTGYRCDEVIGRSPRFLQGPKTQRSELDRIRACLERSQPVRAELINYSKTGREYWLEIDIVPIADAAGTVTHFVAVERDLTARKQSQEERDRLFNLSMDMLAVGNFDGRLEQVNPAWTRCLGWSASELTTRPWLEFVHPEDRSAALDAVHQLARGGLIQDFQNRYLCKDGSLRRLSWNCHPLVETRQIFAVARDITGQRSAELALADSQRARHLLGRCNAALIRSQTESELLSTVCQIAVEVGSFRLAWIGYAVDDADKRVVPQAHAGVEHGYLSGARIGWSEGEPCGHGPAGKVIRTGQGLILPDIQADPDFAPWLPSALEHGFRGVVCLPLKDTQHTFGVLVLYMPEVRVPQEEERTLLDELADNLAFGIVTLRSKAERERIESAVFQVAASVSSLSNEKFFMELARSMASATGAQAGFVARRLPGESLAVGTIAGVVDGEAVDNFEYALEGTPCESLAGEDQCVVPSRVADLFPQSAKLRGIGAQGYVGRRLSDSAGQFVGLLFVLFREPLGSSRLAESTLQIFAARAAAELERQASDLRLREQAALLDHAQDAIIVRDREHRVTYWNAGAERLYGWSASEAMGQSVLDLFYPDRLQFDKAVQELQLQREWSGQINHVDRHGRHFVAQARWTLMHDEGGKPTAVLGINTDISERLALEQRLRQSQRLESVGQLTGGVAHDFNNLLTVILGNAEMLREQLAIQPKLAPLADMVVNAAERGAQLTQRLLAFARKQALVPQAVDVNVLVAGMDILLRRTLGEQIEMEVTRTAGLWTAMVDPAQLDSALLNLCLNARDAMPDGGRLTIETANAHLSPEYCHQLIDVKPGQYVMLGVSDSGVGIALEHQARVFEPFFTTKVEGKGTGLGLAMVYGFVKQSGGHVSLYSELGHGTTVRLYFPRSTDKAQPVPKFQGRAVGGAETILLVEDNTFVRQYARDQLAALGYRVIEVANGFEAMDVIRADGHIDLLFTDVVMPGMNGRELADAARQVRPGLKVLFTSGYTENTIVHQGRLDPGVILLSKPYRREELASRIRDALAA